MLGHPAHPQHGFACSMCHAAFVHTDCPSPLTCSWPPPSAQIVKKGDAELPGLTDEEKPRLRGPKRASKIRKLFNLTKVCAGGRAGG